MFSNKTKIIVTRKPNAIEVKGKNRRFHIIQPLKEKFSEENTNLDLMENKNVILIKSLLTETNQNTNICEIVGKTKQTIIGFTDDGLYELTIALVEYHKNKYNGK